MLSAGTIRESFGELADDPIQIMAEISLRSLPNMAESIPLMVAGSMAAGPWGFAAGAGAGGAMTEYRSSLADSLQQQGVDLTSAESMLAAAANPEIMNQAHDYAMKRSSIIGAAGIVSGGVSTKMMTPFIKNAIGKEVANVAAQTVAQGYIEGAGEALAQLATDGEIHGGEVLAEAIGGAATAPIDVGTATVTGIRAQAIKTETARVDAELRELLNKKVPRETADDGLGQEGGNPVEAGTDPESIAAMRKPMPTTARDLEIQLRTENPGVKINIVDGEKIAELSRIVVPEDQRSQGQGTDIMESVIDWADSEGKIIALSPSNDFGGSVPRLKAFYRRFGFVENTGRNRDYEVSAIMYRPAQQQISYPMAPRDRWFGDADYEARGGEIVQMTPDEFLARAAPLTMDEETRENIDDLKQHIQDGGELDPLSIYADTSKARDSDGRHRANAAKEMGISQVPVVDFTKPRPEVLSSRVVREQLLADAQDLGNDVPARRAQRAVERAVTNRPLSQGEHAIVETMLDDSALSMETPGVEQRQGERRQETDNYVGPERRKADRRAAIRAMSTEQLVDAVYTHPMTGIPNKRAFEEDLQSHAWLAEIDADSLKFINDNISEAAGDAMLIAVAEALDQSDIDAYHVGGDEFYIGGQTEEEVTAAAELAKTILNGQSIKDDRGSIPSINITYGVGQSREIASATMKQHKARREQEGKRAARGVAPPGTVLQRVAKPLDMAPGTNYVGMIGNTGSLPINANHEMVLGNGRIVQIPKLPVRREHILSLMQKAFGVRIYQGTHFKKRNALGFYRPGQGEIRNRNYNDIEVAAHEVAHFLDDSYPWIKNLYTRFDKEIRSVSYDASLIYEGWAEFMRLFMTQEYEAIHRAPAFYDAFRKELANHPKLESTIYDVQELMHAWTQQGARARLASKHGQTAASVYERIASYFRVPLMQSALDGLRRVKQIGFEVAGVDTAYRKLRLALGGSNGVLEAAMYYGTPGWREDGQGLEFTGESLHGIFGQLWGNDDVALYMMARRGLELSEQGRENLMRADEIAAGLAIADEIPGLDDMFERYQAFNQRILDFAEGGGILNPETRAAFVEMNRSYVPFHRVIESEIEGRGVRNDGNPFKRLSGGTQNVANVWDNMVNNTGMIIRAAMVNDGKRSLLSSLEVMHPLGSGQETITAGKYAAPISTRDAPVDIPSDQLVRKVVEMMGMEWSQYMLAREGLLSSDPDVARSEQAVVESVDRMRAGMSEFVKLWQVNLDPIGQVDYYLDEGKKHWFEIGDAGLYDSLQHLGPKGTNLVLQIFGGFSATLRRGVVAVPVFQIKNFIRDTTNAWLLSDHVKVPAARAMRIALSNIEKDPAYQEMFLNGGGFASRAQGLEAQRKTIIDPTRLAATYDRFMSRFENANRLAEYKASREGGVSPRNAAMLSREISTDFAMRGSSEVARFLSISVPFLNARAQGNYRIARQFDTRDHALSYAVRGSALMLATLGLYALNKDDDRYEELPEDVRDLNWVVFTGNGEDDYFLIPKPFESGMIFGTIPERMFQYTEERDGKEFSDAIGWMLLQTFSMDMTPQAFQPEIDLQKNKNFTGAPIIPFYLENVEPSEQFTYYTSVTAKEAGQKFGISPIKLEHRIRGYMGTLGTYALGASDAIIRASTDPDDLAFGESPTRGETWKENILVRGLIDPLVGEGPPRRTKYVTDLYDMIREASKVANTTDLMIRRQNVDVEDYLNNPEKLVQLQANEALASARSALSEIRKQMDLVRMAKDMSGDEKRGKLWELTRQRNQLARQAVTAIRAEQANAQ